MIWVVFFIAACLSGIALIPPHQWKTLWPSGIIAAVMIYFIDSTLISLGAYSLSSGMVYISGLPAFYLLSSFFGGAILINYYPNKTKWRFPFILAAAMVFVFMELIMYWLGFFHYDKWSPVNSYFLNIIGFTSTLWLSERFNATGEKSRINNKGVKR